MKKRFFAFFALLAFMVGVCLFCYLKAGAQTSNLPNDKSNLKRIAILPIRTGAGVSQWWGGTFDPGTAMTDILINHLAESKKYAVFDRKNLDDILKEQNLGQLDRLSPETAFEIGKIAGVQYLITGTVTEFAQVSQNDTGVIGVPGPYGVGIKLGNKKVRTAVELHIIDVNTGFYSVPITEKDETIVGDFSFAGYHAGVGIGYNKSEFVNSALGKSMIKICQSIVKKMDTVEFKECRLFRPLECYVLFVDGDQVFISIGAKAGVTKGMVFSIYRSIFVKDPRTGEERKLTRPIAEIKITDVEEDSSMGIIQNKREDVEPADMAKRVK